MPDNQSDIQFVKLNHILKALSSTGNSYNLLALYGSGPPSANPI